MELNFIFQTKLKLKFSSIKLWNIKTTFNQSTRNMTEREYPIDSTLLIRLWVLVALIALTLCNSFLSNCS